MFSRLMGLLLMVGLVATAAPVLAQTVTYCNDYSGPYGDFTLTIPAYDIADFALLDAEVLLNVTYNGTFNGENIDPDMTCLFGFSMNPALETTDLLGDNMTGGEDINLSGEIAVGGATSLPLNGTFWSDAPVAWNNIVVFYLDQDLNITVPDDVRGYVAEMLGDGAFDWSLDVTAEVCVTYSYDVAVPTDVVSFDSIKASYR